MAGKARGSSIAIAITNLPPVVIPMSSKDGDYPPLDGLGDFRGGREPPRLLPREHDFPVDDHIELALAAHLDFGGHTEALRQVLLEAPGLLASVASEKAAFDDDFH
jgi:hypothetical protein